jgi:diguanylate cyclase (GGDEF)-like protein
MIAVAGYTLQEKMRHNHSIDTYHALRRKDKRKVLLKVPNGHYAASENLALLQHEFQLLKKINAPTIIKACDFLQNTSGPVLVLEDVEGQLLNSYLKKTKLNIKDFFDLALQLVDILGELHQLRIIHKDIKPSNIMINPEKMMLKLIDVSASTKLSEEVFDYITLTSFEEGLAYISPEQTGRINRPVDYRTDFYSLGIILFQMLTNKLPFQTLDPLELVHCHIAKKPPDILKIRPDAPKMLAEIIEKLLQKMPEERYASIIGLKSDLRECQKQWKAKGKINKFLLGMHDTKDHLSISRNLYGREEQVRLLLEAFERVSQGSKEIAFVAGYSGIGKTSLVREVHKPIVKHKGYYIQGKFDQLQQSIPYSAIVTAFQNLVKQVLAENEASLQELKESLIRALGNVGQVVIDVIPEIELIIGKQPPVPSLNPSDAQIRFNLAFQNVVRVFAQPNHPLVIFLDDLQWADNSSLNFIETILQDDETNYLFIIGAYRDNEVDAAHPLQLTFHNLRKNKVKCSLLILKPLQLKNIQQLLCDTFSSTEDKISELAKCIFDKTQGNPFFINEFIKILYQEKILNFSYEHGSWEWDLLKIKQQSATDNVIDLLTAKIHLLPGETQEILKLAACLGHQFDFGTLAIISGRTVSQIAEELFEAINANLIYPLEEPYKTFGLIGLQERTNAFMNKLSYRFAHDRIQQAAYGLINEQDKLHIHLKIGRLLLKDKPLEENDERLFDVMKHFNYSVSLIKNTKERLKLAQYNFWAGRKAKLAAAYYTANEYLSAGVALLRPGNWNTDYKITFQLYKELATCKYLTGDFTAADQLFSTLLENEQDPLDKLEIYRIKTEMLATLGKHTEALKIGLGVLQKFGIKISKNPTKIHILSAIYKIKFQIRNTKIEEINLPPMEDEKYKAIVNLITQLLNSAFITNQQLFALLISKNISLSLKYGYTESISMCIPVYAFVIMHSLNLYDDAISFVALYNKLKKKYGASSFEGRNQFILGTFIEPYQLAFNNASKTVVKAFKLCCEVGDLVYGNYSNLLLVLHALSEGKSLAEVKKYTQATSSFMTRLSISDFGNVAKFWEYMTECFQNPQIANLTQASHFEEEIIKEKNKTEASFFYASLTQYHYLLGNFKEAVWAGKKHELYSDYDKGLISHFTGKFYYALALFNYISQLPRYKRIFCLLKIKKLAKFVEKYAKWCPINYRPHALLIQAEFAYLKRGYVLRLYEQAIEAALSSGSILIAAIANEAAGKKALTHKVDRVAKLYLQNAYRYFKEWGAISKLKLLEKIYPTTHLLQEDIHLVNKPDLHSGHTQTIDILTILKFTQLISSEIRLDKLLQKFMAIVLENSGAQKSIIFTKVNEKWIIEAEGNLEEQLVYLNGLGAANAYSKYPTSLINYVQRTQKPIIINDSAHPELNFEDSYLLREKPRSILVAPLFYQGQLSRILYLENKSSTYTFTENHLDSLHLLSSQAMTSLENARLYYQATHDPLTGLANRNMLYEISQQAIKQRMRTQGKVALLFLDLDYFKVINDTLGHDNGDKLLVHIARILSETLREGDVAARIGGDEFTVMLSNIDSVEQIKVVAERILHDVSKPIQISEHLVQITASMGISIFPTDGNDIQSLLKLADTALYQAKEKGRNQFHFYSVALHAEYQRIHGLDQKLQQAFEKEEFFLMYQPFYDINTGKIIGLETLLRWNSPDGILEAQDFISALEKSPLMLPVSEWVLRTACKQAKIWREKKILTEPLAINISPVQFRANSLSDLIANILSEVQLEPTAIELEITESIFIDYNDNLYHEIANLQALGINLVMDDFGTGYSGLTYLRNLPIKKIKIDKTFIKNCENDYLDQTIISSITMMAHRLGIKVIAEGVENKTQLNLLKKEGVDHIQGYYYSRPLTAEGCEACLKTNQGSW